VSISYDDKATGLQRGTESAYSLGDVVQVMGRVRQAIESVIEGKRSSIDLALVVLLAEGHLLIEDVPGVGKTMLAKALGRSIACSVRRIQFTPDLLPSDITGVSVFNAETRDFEFKPGGIFANIVVGDEINRASPKTQSALLESMEERQVSVDGTTYLLESPFMVVATQNPIEMEGTYPLPEAQRDRFMARIEMGYPTPTAELDMLESHGSYDPLAALQPVTDGKTTRSRWSTPLATPGISGWARLRGLPCSYCGPPAPSPPFPAGTTSARMTSLRWASPCWRTEYCRPPTPSWHGARSAT
jgi:MoxR-like ATPase